MFSDDKDKESTTFSLDDDDECVIEEEVEDSDDDSVEHRKSVITKMFRDIEADGDSNNHNIHDQLPSVEEVKASNSYMPTARLLAQSHRRKLYLTIAAAAFVAMVLSVTISVGVFERSNRESGPSYHEVESRFADVVDFLVDNQVASPLYIKSFQSAEHQAALFVANGDVFNATFVTTDEVTRRRFIERYLLAFLYYFADGDNWTEKYNFLSALDHCSWHIQYSTPQGRFLKGVQCDEEGRVVDLDLSNNNLKMSSVPLEVTKFTHLERLHLFGNDIRGHLPIMDGLKSLLSLGLMNTNIEGTIPSRLGELSMLTTLALGQTKMTGTIPWEIGNLEHLRILGLDGIGLTGRVGPVLHLNKLEALYLEDNLLSGEISGCDWPKMVELDLSNNLIDGRLPESIFKSSSLRVIDLHKNVFFGQFPEEITNNEVLEYIALQGNGLTGSLTDRIGFVKNLKHLDVSGNRMTGTFPDTIQLLTNLVSLSTSGNNFDQQRLVDFLSPLVNLKDLSMKGNSFTGTIPLSFASLSSLTMLDLDGNNLSGTIPSWLGNMSNLSILMLNRNQLTGTIPAELSRLARLEILLLDSNNLTGQTTEICRRSNFEHFITDCYPSMKTKAGPELECRCCTLCCNDENPNCNDKDWSASYDPKATYGYIRPAYDFSLDQAPPEWQKKAREEAQAPSGV